MRASTRRTACAGLIGAVLVGWTARGAAQSTNQTLQRPVPTREEVTPPAPNPAAEATASVDARGAIAQPACPFAASPIRLTLAHVAFTRPDGSALQPAIADALGGIEVPTGDQSIRVVCQLRDEANAALRRAGWVASVQIPAQSIATGELTLHVVSARITEIRVRGTPGPYRHVLEGRIARLKALDPLNQHDAERILLLAGDIPGLDVQLALHPAGTQPGDVIGDLNITYRPFAIFANVQNYNSRALGRETAYVRGEIYGLTGLADVTYIGASTTADVKEQKIVQAGHILGLDGGGDTVGARFTYAWSRPDLGALDLRTDTLITGVDLVHPLVRSVRGNARVALGFDYVDQYTVVASGDALTPLNLDKLRVGFVRASGDLLRRRFDGAIAVQLRGGIDVRKGFGIFDATPRIPSVTGGALPSRIEGDSRALVIRGDLDAVIGLGRVFSIATAVRAQWANDPLLNYEEFSLGNLTIGRGYDPGSNSGDRAVGVRLEPRAELPLSRRFGAELFGFYDFVALTNLDSSSTEVDRRFHSYGGGLRVTLPNRLILEGMYAHPQDKALTIDKAPPPDRFLASLIVQFRGGAR